MDGPDFIFSHQPFADSLLVADDNDPSEDQVKPLQGLNNAGQELKLIPGFDIIVHDAMVYYSIAVEEQSPGAVNP
jgi:hypothetical protein